MMTGIVTLPILSINGLQTLQLKDGIWKPINYGILIF